MMELLKMTPHTRPEELTVDQFIQLGLYLLQNNIQRKDTVDE